MMNNKLIIAFFLIFVLKTLCNCQIDENQETNDENIIVINVASEATDGYLRYLRSAKYYGIKVVTLGMGQPWQGGDMNFAGGGYKVNLLRDAISQYKNDDDKLILVTDSYDVVFQGPLTDIIENFKKTNAKILFGAEPFCWPDVSLHLKYPKIDKGVEYLNSGMFVGYASYVNKMLKNTIKNTEDDQLYYTRIFLEQREKLNIKLDHTSELFQNLYGATAYVKLVLNEKGETILMNTDSNTKPLIIHGNGLSKINLNSYANYLAGAFINNECKICEEEKLNVEENYPEVSISVFIEKGTPFLEEYFQKLSQLNYPKSSLHLFIHNNIEHHDKVVYKYIDDHSTAYKSIKYLNSKDEFTEAMARELAVTLCQNKNCDYLFVVDSVTHLDNPDTLTDLLALNKSIVGPIMTRHEKVWSNFWGALSEKGFYARSNDYMTIVKNEIRGLWNIPYISSCYLIKANVLKKVSYHFEDLDPDMAFCYHMRKQDVFITATNIKDFGHLINDEYYNTKIANPDFDQLFTNKYDWEIRYIHPDYHQQFDSNFTQSQPCPDVYWFKIATDKFCDELVNIVENFGKWSDGSNKDDRIQGGYEAVPTRDIHMKQVGLEQLWLKFLTLYVKPLQEKVFTGYYHDVRSIMNFVVRYKPDEQPSLKPHHDASTYTINIALNSVGVDYQGGGCKFVRYNCAVSETKKGWMLMHPGRLTHLHEGLLTTSGTRYIMISFIDP